MKTASEWFEGWFSREDATENLINLIQMIQDEAYIRGYRDATKGDDPLYEDELGS